MLPLLVGLILFIGAHLILAFPCLHRKVVDRFGTIGLKGVVAAPSLLGFVLIIWGYSAARAATGIVYSPPVWMSHIALLLMLFAMILLVAAYVPGKIKEKAKHPMLAAVKIWGLAHLLANGTVADVVLFGSFLAWAVYARISANRREAAGLITITGGPVRNDIIAVVVGTVAYLVFLLWAHELLIGVAPIA